MSKRPYYVALSVVLLIVLVTLNLSDRQSARIKLLWGSLFMPLFGLAASTESLADQAGSALLPRRVLVRQLDALRRENIDLRFQLDQLRSVQDEDRRLREGVSWQQRAPWRLKISRVIAQDPSNWWRTLLIDLGTRDVPGLRSDLPVLTPDGLVGRLAEVGYARSRVVLVGDPNCRFSAQVEKTRDKGIIAPSDTTLDRLLVEFTYVPVQASLKPGQMVVTSGDGGVFPKDIPVGSVVDVQTNEFGLYLDARVRLAVNLNRLEEVWVMLP